MWCSGQRVSRKNNTHVPVRDVQIFRIFISDKLAIKPHHNTVLLKGRYKRQEACHSLTVKDGYPFTEDLVCPW